MIDDIGTHVIEVEHQEKRLSELCKSAKKYARGTLVNVILTTGAAFTTGVCVAKGYASYSIATATLTLGQILYTIRDIRIHKTIKKELRGQLTRIDELRADKLYQEYVSMQEMLKIQPQKSEQVSPYL